MSGCQLWNTINTDWLKPHGDQAVSDHSIYTYLQSAFKLLLPKKKVSLPKSPIFFVCFLTFSMVNCQTNWGFPEEWRSTWEWEFGALVHYAVLTRLQSSSAGVSLGPLRVLNNASYSLSRELISCKLSNQHWRAWRALKESWVQSDWGLFKVEYVIWTWKSLFFVLFF